MSLEAATVTNAGFEYSGPADDLAADIAALAPQPKADEPATVDVKAEPAAKAAEPAKVEPKADEKPLSAQQQHDRIQRLTWEREEATRRADAAEAREKARDAKPKDEPKAEPTAADHKRYRAMPDAPKQDDYDDVVDYATDMAVFASRKFLGEQRTADARQQATDTRATAARTRHVEFGTALQAEKATDPELDTLLAASDVQIDEGGPMTYVITSAKAEDGTHLGPKIMKYLAQHPNEAARILAIDNAHQRYGEMRVIEGIVRSP